VPASRRSRADIKRGKQVSAAEWRLRAEMGAELPEPSKRVSPAKKKRLAEQRKAVRTEFSQLPPAQRIARTIEFKQKLRPLCLSAEEFRGVWSGEFAPRLDAATASEAKRSASKAAKQAKKRAASTPSPGQHAQATARSGRNSERARRALDIRLRAAAAASKEIDPETLAAELSADKHFRAVWGGAISVANVRKGLKTLGRRSGSHG
jgi:hypothetical protein